MSSETDTNVNGGKTPQQHQQHQQPQQPQQSQQPQQPQQPQQSQQSQQPQQPQQSQQQASAPFTPPRASISSPSRLGISLQVPARGSPTAPALDSTIGYAAVRRPRLDFARACEFPTFQSSSLEITVFLPLSFILHDSAHPTPFPVPIFEGISLCMGIRCSIYVGLCVVYVCVAISCVVRTNCCRTFESFPIFPLHMGRFLPLLASLPPRPEF